MSAVFTPTRHKLSVEDYHKLGDAGILTDIAILKPGSDGAVASVP